LLVVHVGGVDGIDGVHGVGPLEWLYGEGGVGVPFPQGKEYPEAGALRQCFFSPY
jgi:hypothetical protein